MPIEELRIRYEVPSLPEGHFNRTEAHQILAVAYGVAAANHVWFAENPWAPEDLSAAGIRYVPPETCSRLCQFFDGASVLLRRKRATCLSAAPYVLGKMWGRGEQGGLLLAPMVQGGWSSRDVIPHQYHLVVTTPFGIVDPVSDLVDAEDSGAASCSGSCPGYAG